jgi:uridine kinase
MSSHEKDAYVIAVAGTSGAGKTSVAKATAAGFEDAVCLHFDDYATVSSYPQDMRGWLDAGADPDEWQTPRLGEDLRSLKAGSPIEAPNGDRIEPESFIVLEEPFGRARPDVADSIDFVALVDVPMEVALARRLLRDLDGEAPHQPDRYARRVYGFLSSYVDVYRDAYIAGVRLARESCDIEVDGLRTVAEIAEEIAMAARVARRVSEQSQT